MKDALSALSNQARVLGDQVDGLSSALEQIDRRTNRSERVNIVLSFVLALVVVVCVAVAWVVAQQAAQGEALARAIARESDTRQQALCPLYALLLGSYNPGSRAPGPDRDKYNAQFVIMRDAYQTLDCLTPIVPPRIDQPSAPPIPPR